jgi:hypothetical protein
MHKTSIRIPRRRSRRVSHAAAIAAAIALAASAPVAAAGSNQIVETWTDEPTGLWYQGDFSTGFTVAGYGLDSGMARITETPNGGVHVRGHAEGVVQFYEAFGPPWDVTFGAFVGTWSYSAHFDEQIAPGEQGSLGDVIGGRMVYADGSSQYRQVVFRLVLQPDGPPKLFLVRAVCGGVQ